MSAGRVLVVDDDAAVRELLVEALDAAGYRGSGAASGAEALAALGAEAVDLVLLDVRLGAEQGSAVLRDLKRHDPDVEVVMITGFPDVDSAVETLKSGASDYLIKPLNVDALCHTVARVLERRFLRREVTALRLELGAELGARELLGDSPEMARVRELVRKVAASDAPVLIEGESGTGKEVAAAAIHRTSPRARAPFVPVNCGAIPDALIESELFGHVRGAFSGAVADAPGLFRAADGGTIFLDEIAELPPPLQVKLLRALQQREVRPVGSVRTHRVDVRVVAATNQRLDEAVRAGRFREDLFYRLAVLRIEMPPLRRRRSDIPLLVAHILERLNRRYRRAVRGLAPDAQAALAAYDFPGNVRELENLIERAYTLGARDTISLADLGGFAPRAPAAAADALPTLAAMERELIVRALERHGGDRRRAAEALGISDRTIYRRLRQYGLR